MEQAKKHFLKNLVGFSMVSWVSFAIGFIATPIGTRLFPPEEWGKINLFHTYATLLASLCYLGLDQAFVRFFREPPGNISRAGMLSFCAITSLSFSLLSSALLLFGWRSVSAGVTGDPDLPVFICLCLFSSSTVLFRYLSLCYRMEQNTRLYSIQGILHVLLTKIGYLAAGVGGGRGATAILVLTFLMAALTGVFTLIQRKRFDLRLTAQINKPFLKDMTLYAAPLIPLTLITWLNSSVSSLTLRQLEGFGAVGIYSSALGLASSVNVIQTGFNTYWAPYIYENYQSGNSRRFFTVHRLMACLLTFFGLTVTVLQVPIFLLLGERYRGSAVFFPYLFLAPICYCLSETTGIGIGIAKKTYWNTIAFLVSVLVNLGLCLWLIPWIGPSGAALSSAVAAIFSLALRTWAGEKYYQAIPDYRYLVYAVFLMMAAATGNILLTEQSALKYALFTVILGLAGFLFRHELWQLIQTARQLLHKGD